MTTPKTEDSGNSADLDSELRKQLEDFELEGVVTHRRAGSFKDTYIFTIADVNRLEALIASQTQEAYKKGYIDGGIEMSSQVSAAENRLLDALEALAAREGYTTVHNPNLFGFIASHRPQTTSSKGEDYA